MLLAYVASPELRQLSDGEFRALVYDERPAEVWERYKHNLQPFLRINSLLLLLTALVAAATVKDATGKFWPAWLVLIAVSFNSSLLGYGEQLYVETAYTFTLALASSLIYAAVRRQYLGLYAAAGLSVSALILTRASFFYFLPILAIAAPVLIWRTPLNRRQQFAVGYATLFACSAIGPALWMVRNRQVCGDAGLRSGGNVVLAIRASYLDMNPVEYVESLVYWSPTVDDEKFYQWNQLEPGTSRLDRRNPDGFYRRVKDDPALEVPTYCAPPEVRPFQLASRRADATLQDIGSKPLRYAASILPFAYQGFFIDTWISKSLLGGLIVNTIESAALICLVVRGWKTRNTAILLFILPSGFAIAFHAALTHNIPRFNIPVLPAMYAATAIVLANEVTPRLRGDRPLV
jgi:hypothetical protein